MTEEKTVYYRVWTSHCDYVNDMIHDQIVAKYGRAGSFISSTEGRDYRISYTRDNLHWTEIGHGYTLREALAQAGLTHPDDWH